MAESYGLQDLGELFDAVLRRQKENLGETVARTRAEDASVVQYAQDAAAWQRQQNGGGREPTPRHSVARLTCSRRTVLSPRTRVLTQPTSPCRRPTTACRSGTARQCAATGQAGDGFVGWIADAGVTFGA